MEIGAWLGLFAANFVACAVPGQNVAFVSGAAMRCGSRAGLAAITGILLAEAVWTLLALAILAGLLNLAWLRDDWLYGICGIVLFVIGFLAVLTPEDGDAPKPAARPGRRGAALGIGAVVGLANPMALAFFVAMMPQFLADIRISTAVALACIAAIVLSALAALMPYLALALAGTVVRRGTALQVSRGFGAILSSFGAVSVSQAFA